MYYFGQFKKKCRRIQEFSLHLNKKAKIAEHHKVLMRFPYPTRNTLEAEFYI